MNVSVKDDLAIFRIRGPRIFAIWDDIEPHLHEVLEKSNDEVPPEWIREELVRGVFDLWVCLDNSEEVSVRAFTITSDIVTANGTWRDMPFSYSDGEMRISNSLFRHVVEKSKEEGYIGVKFITSQPKVMKWAVKHGMKERYREFILPFELSDIEEDEV